MEYDDTTRKNSIEYEAAKRALKNTRKWKLLIAIFILLGIISPILTIRATNSLQQMGQTLGARYKEMSADKPGKQAALQAVNSWLDDKEGAFRSGTNNLLWDTATKVETTTKTNSGNSNSETTDYWSHELSFTDLSDGTTRDVTQLVSITNGIATAVGEPTLLPKSITGNSSASYSPSSYQRLDQPESFTNVATAWAKAYIGKDYSALTVLVGDPNSSHAYQPASIGTLKNLSINWMAACTKTGQPTDKDDDNDNPEYACASLSITFNPYTVNADSTNDNDDTNNIRSIKTNITVLIKNPTRGSAKIVDWGADGSLTTLSPYANAVDKSILTSSSEEDSEEETASSTSDSSASSKQTRTKSTSNAETDSSSEEDE